MLQFFVLVFTFGKQQICQELAVIATWRATTVAVATEKLQQEKLSVVLGKELYQAWSLKKCSVRWKEGYNWKSGEPPGNSWWKLVSMLYAKNNILTKKEHATSMTNASVEKL